MDRIPAHWRWYQRPLGLFVHCVRCDACLEQYYRVRLVGWLFARARRGLLRHESERP
jgi:hypothetical protein